MDDFGVDRTELSGALLSLEFGQGGRITSLWASDPNLPEEGDEFQFVLGPVNFGEEIAEDYYPGTFLVGARMSPDEPWIVSRGADAEPFGDDPGVIEFEYELSLLPELRATGKYYEIPGPIPVIAWDLRLANRGTQSIEIGELAFPFALNNLYEGFGRTEQGAKNLWNDRVVIHKYIGGAASWLFAQRLTAAPPGLLIMPGEDTGWEFFAHVPSSLQAPFRWEGVPLCYVHSQATIEREGWDQWANGHTSIVLEPGDSRTYQTRFVPTERDRYDAMSSTLAILGHPAVKLLTAAVAPTDVGIAVEVTGATPTRFIPERAATLETDSDEEGGFCFVKPSTSGPFRLDFEDSKGRTSNVHLFFTEPIDILIRRRADYIVANQIHREAGSSLDHAILVANTRQNQRLVHPDEYTGPFAVEGGLGDALFLAEKNAIYPDRTQIQVLDQMIDGFLRDDLQNPGDCSVGSAFADTRGVALNYSRPHVYPLVFNLYHAMYRVARVFGETARESREYLALAAGTALAMVRYGIPRQGRSVGFPGYSRIFSLLADLSDEGMHDDVDKLMPFVSLRADDLLKRDNPYQPGSLPDSGAFEEVFTAARYLNDERHQDQALRTAYAMRSLAPSWWWYGCDSRQWDEQENGAFPAPSDLGEMCLGYTGPENSLMFFEMLDRDYAFLPEAYMRLAFGGMLGVWALVRDDGAASMAYCPDPASRHFGFSPLTGDLGLSLFHYLRGAGSYVLPSRMYGVFTFGCHFEVDEKEYTVRPWDGVGRRVVLRQVGAEFTTSVGKIKELKLDVRKRWASLLLENPADKDLRVELRIRGMWGRRFLILGEAVEAIDGELAVAIPLAAHGITRVEIKVKD